MVGDYLKPASLIKVAAEEAIEIVKFFNNHSRPLGLLRAQMKRSPDLGKVLTLIKPVLTRWTCHLLAMRRLLEVRKPMISCVNEHEDEILASLQPKQVGKARHLLRRVMAPDFWSSIEE